MDTKDLKGFLYGWLGKQKLGQPSYTTNSVNRGGTQRFKCELRVPGHSYTGVGNSMNKKDAMTNAAMDFCNYLVRQGSMQASEVPALNASSLEATSAPVIGEFPPPSGGGSFFGGTEGAGDTKQEPWSPAGPNRSVHDRYVTQKAEEIAQSESIDLKADIHGGWTMENCKSALNELMQKMRQPAVCYNTQLREANMCRTFVTTVAVFIPQLGKNVSAQGQGSSKKVAEAAAAMSLVRQLFHLGIMAAFKGDRKRTTASNLPEIPLQIAPDLSERVRSFVEKAGVVPAAVDPETCTAEEPKSLMIDCKLAHFPDSEVEPAGNVSWAPPMLNWNPWRAANIDELPLSVMNLPEISSKINEKEAGKFRNQEMIDTRDALPVHQFRDQIVETVRTNQVTLIKGETGCGKSTQVAQFLLDAFVSEGKGAEFNAFVSQPRRISAITLAERVANEREETLGESVGYGVRFDSVSPRPYGAIMFCTVGVLLRKMESGLRGVSHVIIDEIHERDVNTDFVLVVLREMVREYSDLRIILMSATIDTQLFTEFFGKCPVIEMHGRTHPVKHFFLEDIVSNQQFMPPMPEKMRKEDEMEEEGEEDKNKNLNVVGVEEGHVKQAMSRLSEREIPICVIEALLNDITKRAEPGSVLVFLPGWNEIMLVMNHLNAHPEYSDTSKFVILPLHSQLTGSEQRKVFDHFGPNIRKIILSTNIAETSVTIDDVVYVIDSCKAKERMYTSNNNMVHFATVWASRTNLTQRRGRAGRVRPGYAFHLCSKARFEALDEHRTAEILRTPLHEIALTIKLLRLGSVGEFLSKAIEPPPYDMVVESEAVLQNMGALDRNLELTPLGRILARLPIEPIMGKTIVLATSLGIGSLMCQLAAGSSFSSPFVPRERSHTRLSGAQRSFAGDRWSDHVALINVNQQYQDASEQGGPAAEASFCQRYSLSPTILKMTGGACRQLLDIMCNQCGFPTESLLPIPVVVNGAEPNLDLLTSLLVSALYPNICFFRGKRKVYTLEQASAIVSKTSVLTPFKGEIVSLPSPLIVFTEKIRTRVIACKELSVISAVQLLLFGCRKVECIGKDLVRFDDMVTVRMDVSAAAAIVALRPCVEALMVRTCTNPEAILAKTEEDIELGQLVRDLSSSHLFADAVADKDYLLTDRAAQQIAPPPSFGRGRGGRGGFAPRGAGSHNGWGMSAGPPRGGFNGGGGWNSGGGKWNSPPRGHGFRGTPYPPRGGGFSRGRGSRGGSWF